MIIDFRMRPPFKSFTKMGGLFGPEGSVHCFPLNGDDAWPVPSADNLDKIGRASCRERVF